MAVFSISGYAWASWRNHYKPFNPVLGETYENLREDRGFHYISEQVAEAFGGPPYPRFPTCCDAVCSAFRSAITRPSPPATQSPKTSPSGKVGAERSGSSRTGRTRA